MAKSPAQRQAEYRQRAAQQSRFRLNLYINAEARAALGALCRRDCVTMAVMIERLAIASKNEAVAGMDDDELAAFYGGVTA